VELPDLGINDSKLAEEVIEILRSTDDKYDLAHKMVAIADDKIRNQSARDTIDIAIEMARTPNFTLSDRGWKKIRRLLLSAKEEMDSLEKTSNSSVAWVMRKLKIQIKNIINRIPKTVSELVFEKLSKGDVNKQYLSPYYFRILAKKCLKDVDWYIQFREYEALKPGLERVREALLKSAEIAGLKL
jgi:hypothetical protein